jgi:hypothetical protein
MAKKHTKRKKMKMLAPVKEFPRPNHLETLGGVFPKW